MPRLLDRINSPADLKELKLLELKQLAAEIRQELISTVMTNGGHLASNLGIVELTIALHRVFDSPRDKIIWDVGHQAYTHKLLTGRRQHFASLRQFGGISGYTSRSESEHDPFGAGHASTSISAALGMAVARDLTRDNYHIVSIIGDGAITGGMALEAINQAGHLKKRLIVILNDNGMSISPTVGALAKFLSKVRFNNRYHGAIEKGKEFISALPMGKTLAWAEELAEAGVKGIATPVMFWDEFGFAYMGPIDGHNINEIEVALSRAKEYTEKPVLVHVITTKGKGHQPAESDACYFHGLAAKNGDKKSAPTYSEVFAQALLNIMRSNPRVVAITPAMPEGNCLSPVQAEFPGRIFDVGICEQHAVTFAAGLATQGMIPVVAIYSTFLQRAFDQIVHDVCLQNLHVVFAMDRSGIVGDDGKTHQGTFDLSYLTLIPNLIVSAPKDENELQHLLYSAVQGKAPMAVRYPRSPGLGVALDKEMRTLPIGKAEILRNGEDLAILALGYAVAPAMEAADMLSMRGLRAAVVNSRFAKPLDTELILELADRFRKIVTVEENTLIGGFGSGVTELLQKDCKEIVQVRNIGLPDIFVEHGAQAFLRAKYSLDARGIADQITSWFPCSDVQVLLAAEKNKG